MEPRLWFKIGILIVVVIIMIIRARPRREEPAVALAGPTPPPGPARPVEVSDSREALAEARLMALARRAAATSVGDALVAEALGSLEEPGLEVPDPDELDPDAVAVLDGLHEAGILSDKDLQAASCALAEFTLDGPQGAAIALGETSAALCFDAEYDFMPVPHDELVEELAELSGGRFKPTFVSQEWEAAQGVDPDDVPYTVRFVHAERVYRFGPANLHDYYDVPSVAAACNRALADAGIPERFVLLDTGGQDACVMFGPPERLTEVLADLGLQIHLPDEPRA